MTALVCVLAAGQFPSCSSPAVTWRPTTPCARFCDGGKDGAAFAAKKHHKKHHKRPDVAERGMDEEVHGFVNEPVEVVTAPLERKEQ